MKPLFLALSFAAMAVSLSACDPLTATVVGGAGAVGMGAAQERGLEGAVDDAKIRTDINGAWIKSSFSLFNSITLNILEGRVMLTGSVESAATREEAVRLTWQTAGVRQVYDEIQVTSEGGFGSTMKDTWMLTKLRTNLATDSDVKNINYYEDVVNGVAYILGIAQDERERNNVIAEARNISGVRKVVDHTVLKNDRHRSAP